MSRKSYGADVFSPVASDSSFKADVGNSDSFDLWQVPYGKTENHFNSEAKEKDPFTVYLCKEEVSSIDKVPDSTQSVIQSKTAVEKSSKKSSLEADASRFSYITTRSKGSREELLGVIPENQSNLNATVSKTRKKNRLAVQPETVSNKELLFQNTKQTKEFSTSLATSSNPSKEISTKEIKQSRNSATVSAISADPNKHLLSNKIRKNTNLSLAVTDFKKELFPSKISQNEESFPLSSAKKQPNESQDVDSMKSDFDTPGVIDKQAETCKVLSKSNMVLKKSHSKTKKVEKDSKVTTKKNSQVEKPKELAVEKENQRESAMSENFNAEPAPSISVSKTNQVQANIIEKLVKDAVSFEFDQIRQMLYLHQLQLLRSMDKNFKTIEELVEENRRLKDIIAQQNT